MDPIRNPHDKLFHEIYSHKEEAQSFLECYLPQDLLKQIDPDSLEIRKDSFVDEDLQAYYSDLLYTVTLHGQPGYVYVLFEHKSYPDRLVHLQVLEYMVKIWRQHLKQRDDDGTQKHTAVRLPLILPLVLYHGEQSWPYSVDFSGMLSGPKEQMAPYIPDFRHVLIDLTAYPDREIKGTILSRVMLLLFKHIFDPELRQTLPEILHLMEALLQRERGVEYIELFLRYLCSATDRISNTELLTMAQKAIVQEGGTIVMTIAERWIQEGVEKGLEKGLEEGREKGREEGIMKGVAIGEILFAQKLMKFTFYDRKELEHKRVEELNDILEKIEAKKDREEGALKGVAIGGILFAQKLMKLTIYDRKELEHKKVEELNDILEKMEAKIGALSGG